MSSGRITLARNPNFIKDGLKAYGQYLTKFAVTPTLEGPFDLVHEVFDDSASLLGRLRKQDNSVGTRPLLLKRDVAGRAGHVAATDVHQDTEYLAPVAIGTPAQVLHLQFDTGSADLWMWSAELPKTIQKRGSESGHNIYRSADSTSFRPSPGQNWQIRYGDGSNASGIVGIDTIDLGGLKINGQSIELAQHLSEGFMLGSEDGLLGLAFGSINTVQPHAVHTPVENMMTQSNLSRDSQLFTAYLTNSRDHVPPAYTFGYIDSELVAGGTINYAAVDSSRGFWQFSSAYSEVNGTRIPLCDNTAIADTGTTLALVDDVTCKLIYSAIPGASYDKNLGAYVFPARTRPEQLPVVNFAIGDKPFTVHKEDLAFADAGHGMSFGGIQSRGSLSFNIYGDTCLKGMYAIFDQGNKRFGFVQKPERV